MCASMLLSWDRWSRHLAESPHFGCPRVGHLSREQREQEHRLVLVDVVVASTPAVRREYG